MVTWLIDISNHQGAFDVGRAVSEGYAGVWMKATEGVGWEDWTFDTFAPQVIATGAIPGAYHYLRAGSGRDQCDEFYDRIRTWGGPDGWLVACDNEVDASWQTTVDFFARWRELAGDHPMFMYSGNWWWGCRGWDGASLTPYLWDSRYVNGSDYGSALYEQVPESWWSSRYGGWGAVTVLQFSSSGLVAGRQVDVNAFRGTVDELRALARGGGSGGVVVPPPASEGGSGSSDGDWNLEMSFDEFKDGTVSAAPPAWMGGPRDRMRMGDWYGALPGKLSEIHSTAMGAASTAGDARNLAEAARVAAGEARVAAEAARDLAQQTLDRMSALVGGVDVAALAAALAPMLPAMVVPSAAEVADAVVDEEAARLAG